MRQFTSDSHLITSLNSLFVKARNEHVLIFFSISSIMMKIATMISSILILHWISPATMGIWQTLLLVQSYGDIVNAGVLRGLNRELPFLLGQGKQEEAHRIVATAQFYTILTSVLGAVCFVSATFIFNFSTKEWHIGLICMAFIWAANSFSNYLEATFRSHTEFKKLAYLQLFEASLIVLTLYMVAYAGYIGLTVRFALLTILVMICEFWVRPIRVWPRFNWLDFKSLLQTGLPLYVIGYLNILALGFDRVILLQHGGTEVVGLYAPVLAVINVMSTIPNSLVLYIYPRMSFNFGKYNKPETLWRISVFTMFSSIAASIPIAIIGWFVIPLAMQNFFPQYLPSLTAVQISLVAGVLSSAISINTVLYSLKAWRLLYFYMGIFIGIKWIFPWFFAQIYSPLTGVAIGGLISAAIIGIIAILTSFRATHPLKKFLWGQKY